MEAKKLEETIGLGDIVSLQWNDGYDNGTISQVHKDGTVDVFRPYTATADFSMCGSHEGSSAVICYIGIETVKGANPERMKLLRKHGPLR
jgi:hypothetical protein